MTFSDSDQTLGGRMSLARSARGLSVEQVAKRLGVKESTINNWEGDRSEPRPSKMQMLAGVLNVPVLWLLAGKTVDNELDININVSETSKLVSKLDQLHHHHQQTAKIIFELMSDIRRLQHDLDQDAGDHL